MNVKIFITALLILLLGHGSLWAQKATITEKMVSMKTYMFSDPSPVAQINKSYPYCRFDGFTNHATLKEWKMVVMENDYVKVYITPEIGGKIWGAIEKSTGGEFLYYNDVVKFRDVALRGPWTSGGLEYNFGIMSHVSTCSTPQDYVICENEDGSVSCVIGALDLHTRTRWNVEVKLDPDKAFVETIASWFNTRSVPVTYYHYMNAAAKTEGNLEFIYPGSHYIGHGGEVGGWPYDQGREISFYENNNFGGYKSYHVLNAYTDYMGGYWHDDDFGFGHLCDYDERPGKKLWIWGLSPQGMIWVDLLTDTKGQYIELQSGKLFNQAMTQSSYTPFKHREFIPHDSDVMREIWFPVKGTGGMVAASRYGILNVIRKGDSAEIRLSALQDLNQSLLIKADDRIMLDEKLTLKPLELYTTQIDIGEGKEFAIELGDHLLDYRSAKDDRIVNRPLEGNPDFNWDSAIGLYTKGLELEKQQSYIEGNAYSLAHDFYLKSLEKDPAYAPALNRLGLSYYRRMDYPTALESILKSLAIDTYDPEANYFYGLINTRLHRYDEAKSGFSIASQSTGYRSASYTELALLFLREKQLTKAAGYAEKALIFNQHNAVALEILAVVYRLQENDTKADKVLADLEMLDRTSPLVAYEKVRHGQAEMSLMNKLITNELPYETYLELAIRYDHFDMPNESIKILKSAPDYPIISFWLAYLEPKNEEKWLTSGLEKSPDLVFPFREETLEVLQHLIVKNDHWKLKYYAALIYWKKGLEEQARDLMTQCGTAPDYAPFYLTKARLFSDNATVSKEAILKARSISGTDWRVNLAWIDQLMAENQFEEAARLARNTLKLKPEMAMLGIRYGEALLRSGEYRKCLDFLYSFEVLPYEGANEGRNIYHEASIRGAIDYIKKKNYKQAIQFARKAKEWPVNLGAGRPYEVDERFEDFIIANSTEKLNQQEEAKKYYTLAANEEERDVPSGNVNLLIRMKALDKLGRQEELRDILRQIEEEGGENRNLQWIQSVWSGEVPDSLRKEILASEMEESPVDNQFLLVNELLSVIE